MAWALIAGIVVVSYLLGSIPTGYLVARARGIDIREHGSGNIGATNTFRILGAKAGIFVLLCDAAKGFVAVWVASWLIRKFGLVPVDLTGSGNSYVHDTYYVIVPPTVARIVAAIGAILGHSFTCWLGFKGGKGVATSAGAIIALAPIAALGVIVVFVIVVAASRYVSLASIVAAAAFPVAVWLVGRRHHSTDWLLFGFAVAAAGLIVWRHRANIRRLLAGTESRLGKKPQS